MRHQQLCPPLGTQLTGTQRVLLFGSWNRAYPEPGVRLVFGFLQAQFVRKFGQRQPVVIVHGANPYGVDDMAEKIAREWRRFGWTTEPHAPDWSRCSPFCEGADATHRKWSRRLGNYCPNAGHFNNQRLADFHHNPEMEPYNLCVALPWRSWAQSDEVADGYERAKAAGIKTMALGPDARFFTDPARLRKLRM